MRDSAEERIGKSARRGRSTARGKSGREGDLEPYDQRERRRARSRLDASEKLARGSGLLSSEEVAVPTEMIGRGLNGRKPVRMSAACVGTEARGCAEGRLTLQKLRNRRLTPIRVRVTPRGWLARTVGVDTSVRRWPNAKGKEKKVLRAHGSRRDS